jgi:hypothetical protein
VYHNADERALFFCKALNGQKRHKNGVITLLGDCS